MPFTADRRFKLFTSRIGRVLTLWMLLLMGAFSCTAALAAQTLEVRFLDVGQGDAALIITPERRAVLIDAGPNRKQVATRVRGILRAEKIDTLTLAIASHAHADHLGGMAEVLTTIPVANYLDNGEPYTTATYRRTMDVVERRGIRYLGPEPRTLTVGGASFRVLPMPDRVANGDQNNRSVGVLVTYGSFTALFTGDAERVERAFWRERGGLPARVTVLKVSHHGSWNGTDAPWLQAIRPELAVISVGSNTYGHPHQSALTALERAGVKVYRTDHNGEVRVTVQPDGRYTVRTSRKAPRPQAATREPAGRQPSPRQPDTSSSQSDRRSDVPE